MELTNNTGQLILLNINRNYSFPTRVRLFCCPYCSSAICIYPLFACWLLLFKTFCMDCTVDCGKCRWICKCSVQSNRWSLVTILRWLLYQLCRWLQLYALLKCALWAGVNWLELIRSVCIFSKMYELCLSVGFLWTRRNENSIYCVGHTRWDCTLWMKLRIHPNL